MKLPKFSLSSGGGAKHCKARWDFCSICFMKDLIMFTFFWVFVSALPIPPGTLQKTTELPFVLFFLSHIYYIILHILFNYVRCLCSDTLCIWGFHCILVGFKDTHKYLVFLSWAVFNIKWLCVPETNMWVFSPTIGRIEIFGSLLSRQLTLNYELISRSAYKKNINQNHSLWLLTASFRLLSLFGFWLGLGLFKGVC